MTYTLKVWKNKKEFDKGNSTSRNLTEKDSKRIDILIAGWNSEALNNDIFGFEVYETKSGETYYNSCEVL